MLQRCLKGACERVLDASHDVLAMCLQDMRECMELYQINTD